MSKLIHALGMKLQKSVSSKVVYKVILVTHLQAIVQVKEISFWRNCGAASVGEWYTKIWFINGVRAKDEGLTLEKSAFQSLYGGQFTLSTPLINQIFVQIKNEVSNSGTFSVVPRSFNANVNAGVMVEWIVRVLCNPATVFDLRKARYAFFLSVISG